MVENIWCIICKDIITDKQTNTVSYINCLEQIKAPKLPINIPPFSLGTLWEKISNNIEILKIRITIETPSGNKKKPFETKNIKIKKRRHRVNIVIGGFSVEEEGAYKFIIEYFDRGKYNFVKKIPLYVNVRKTIRKSK